MQAQMVSSYSVFTSLCNAKSSQIVALSWQALHESGNGWAEQCGAWGHAIVRQIQLYVLKVHRDVHGDFSWEQPGEFEFRHGHSRLKAPIRLSQYDPTFSNSTIQLACVIVHVNVRKCSDQLSTFTYMCIHIHVPCWLWSTYMYVYM